MQLLLSTVLLAISASSALAKEKPWGPVAHQRYASGEVMNRIMAHKEACKNLDVTGHLAHKDLGTAITSRNIGSSIWGDTVDGREFVTVAQVDGTAFTEVVGKGWWNYVPIVGKAEGTLDYLRRLPQQTIPSLWCEIRDYKGRYAIIGSEAEGHGIQIFDIRKVFDIKADVHHFGGLPTGRTHNIVGAAASNHIISVGAVPRAEGCAAGLIFIDLTDIIKPIQSGCAPQGGYVHDAQCLIYHGPDKKFEGREICYAYNEDALVIYDITDKKNATILSTTSTTSSTMNMTSTTGLARLPISALRPTSAIISSLEAPVLSGNFKSPSIAIDHNQYIKNYFSYQAQYGAGLRILDVASVRSDPTGGGIQEVAFLDVYPEDDQKVADIDFYG
ncbi:hypothetical protein BKA70DRAFT_1429152 [Coprinopsis sp. MPI-PUGE-AT-0042]|nr:hypothetical protein BKA70DRAFT_1429152 [Coprinopsis sp. MPI-PUGE-AT-0042]